VPIYKYECTECNEISSYMHSYEQVQLDCEKCNAKNCLTKLLAKPNIQKNKNFENKNSDVGNITKKFIEENREVLKKQKEDYSKQDYDKP
tara:strand:+ start:302 stop:571 length:270 start_codon:yes stop_codon:yes gene_type:complete